jgi:hypothetical protein
MYLVGDTSGAGFGSTNWTQNEETFDADYGTWNRDVAEKELSSFREAGKLIIGAKALIWEGETKKDVRTVCIH